MKNSSIRLLFTMFAAALVTGDLLTSCSDDTPEEQQNVVNLNNVEIITYTDRNGTVFAPEIDANGWYGPAKMKFVAGDVLHAQLRFDNKEELYTNAILQENGKWQFNPNPVQAEGVKLERTIFLYDNKDDLYADEKALNKAWNLGQFSEGYTNPFNYPDLMVQRGEINGSITFDSDLSVSISLEHFNAIVMIDRIDNRIGKDIAGITAYNYLQKAQPNDDDEQEYYPLSRVGNAETPWLTTFVPRFDNTLNEFKVRFADNQEIIVPVEKPDWDTTDSAGAELTDEVVYYVSLVIDKDPAKCKATIR